MRTCTGSVFPSASGGASLKESSDCSNNVSSSPLKLWRKTNKGMFAHVVFGIMTSLLFQVASLQCGWLLIIPVRINAPEKG